jgi:putative salt-induced outer membrane protein YdiY
LTGRERMKVTPIVASALAAALVGSPAAAQDVGPPVDLPPPSAWAPSAGELDSLLPPLVETLPSPGPLEEPLPIDSLEAAITPTPMWYHPYYWFGEEPWTAGLELGINGSEGNNNVFSMRTGGHAKRETKRWKFDSSMAYNKNHSNGVETQNNGKLDARIDRILAESPWTLFFLENLIYDEFQAFDIQLSLNAGVGYRLLDTETIDLVSRFGAGATREFGGPDDDWQPTALAGIDYEHQITKMQRATAKIDYFPEWEDFRQYRVVTDLGWQIDLDQPRNVSLKLSLIDRYDSTPDGVEPNSFDYAVLLIWGI